MAKMYTGWCPVCKKTRMLTTMDKPIGSACKCTICGTGLSVTGKNQILTLPFFAFVCYIIFALPFLGRGPNAIELTVGLITLLVFTLYQKKFIHYKPMD